MLEARGLDVSEAERSRITNCTDRRQLKKWLKRAVTAEKVADLFAWKLAEACGASRLSGNHRLSAAFPVG